MSEVEILTISYIIGNELDQLYPHSISIGCIMSDSESLESQRRRENIGMQPSVVPEFTILLIENSAM
jgi:hypothetical protein